MKKIFLLIICWIICCHAFCQTGSVGIGTTNPNASAALDIQSTSKGVLIPRMSSVQRQTIPTPATGLLVFDNNTQSFWFKNSTNWIELLDTTNNIWKRNGSQAYINANVGIGTTFPLYPLDVNGSARITSNLHLESNGFIGGNLEVDGAAVIDNTINAHRNFLLGGYARVGGNLTVNSGKGIVRSNNDQQLIVVFPSGSVSFVNAPAGYTSDVLFPLPDIFTTPPHVSVAEIFAFTGNIEHWTVTVHSVDHINNRFTVRFHNTSSGPSSFSGTYRFIAMGPTFPGEQ